MDIVICVNCKHCLTIYTNCMGEPRLDHCLRQHPRVQDYVTGELYTRNGTPDCRKFNDRGQCTHYVRKETI